MRIRNTLAALRGYSRRPLAICGDNHDEDTCIRAFGGEEASDGRWWMEACVMFTMGGETDLGGRGRQFAVDLRFATCENIAQGLA
jgi:hypothetical protein